MDPEVKIEVLKNFQDIKRVKKVLRKAADKMSEDISWVYEHKHIKYKVIEDDLNQNQCLTSVVFQIQKDTFYKVTLPAYGIRIEKGRIERRYKWDKIAREASEALQRIEGIQELRVLKKNESNKHLIVKWRTDNQKPFEPRRKTCIKLRDAATNLSEDISWVYHHSQIKYKVKESLKRRIDLLFQIQEGTIYKIRVPIYRITKTNGKKIQQKSDWQMIAKRGSELLQKIGGIKELRFSEINLNTNFLGEEICKNEFSPFVEKLEHFELLNTQDGRLKRAAKYLPMNVKWVYQHKDIKYRIWKLSFYGNVVVIFQIQNQLFYKVTLPVYSDLDCRKDVDIYTVDWDRIAEEASKTFQEIKRIKELRLLEKEMPNQDFIVRWSRKEKEPFLPSCRTLREAAVHLPEDISWVYQHSQIKYEIKESLRERIGLLFQIREHTFYKIYVTNYYTSIKKEKKRQTNWKVVAKRGSEILQRNDEIKDLRVSKTNVSTNYIDEEICKDEFSQQELRQVESGTNKASKCLRLKYFTELTGKESPLIEPFVEKLEYFELLKTKEKALQKVAKDLPLDIKWVYQHEYINHCIWKSLHYETVEILFQIQNQLFYKIKIPRYSQLVNEEGIEHCKEDWVRIAREASETLQQIDEIKDLIKASDNYAACMKLRDAAIDLPEDISWVYHHSQIKYKVKESLKRRIDLLFQIQEGTIYKIRVPIYRITKTNGKKIQQKSDWQMIAKRGSELLQKISGIKKLRFSEINLNTNFLGEEICKNEFSPFVEKLEYFELLVTQDETLKRAAKYLHMDVKWVYQHEDIKYCIWKLSFYENVVVIFQIQNQTIYKITLPVYSNLDCKEEIENYKVDSERIAKEASETLQKYNEIQQLRKANEIRDINNEAKVEVSQNFEYKEMYFRKIMKETEEEKVREENDLKARSANLIIRGVPEICNEKADQKRYDENYVNTLLGDLANNSISPKSIFRLGKIGNDKIRPMKVVLTSEEEKNRIMTNLFKLKDNAAYEGMSVYSDYTGKERNLLKEYALKAKERNESLDPKSEYIWCVRGTPKDGLILKKLLKKRQPVLSS